MATWMWVAKKEYGVETLITYRRDETMRRDLASMKNMNIHGPMHPQLFCWGSGEVTVYFPRDPVPRQYPDLDAAKVVLTMKGLLR